eukprot:Nitzschia sp. Nitz4//NODE_590_length_10398_cov_65.316349//8637//10001//NITZ4_additional_000087-RA//1//CDS//3329531992//2725//frame0
MDSSNSTLPPIETSYLSEAEQTILGCLSLITGTLSFVASLLISTHKTPYKRIILGLSISDLIASATYATSQFCLPSATSTRVWALGNDATCSFSGFMNQLSFLELWYNGCLSFYYLATVRFGVSSTSFARKYEPWIHISTVLWNLGSSLLGLLFGIYDELPLGTTCWIDAEFPEGCIADDSCMGETIAWGVAGIWGIFFFLAIIINNLIIYRFVRTTLAKSRRNSLGGPNTQEKQLQAVATQGFLYVASFLLTYGWGFALRLVEFNNNNDSNNHFWLVAMNAFFLPMQGCFNITIYYIRPEYQHFQREFPEKGSLWILKHVLQGRRVSSRLGTANFDTDQSLRSMRFFLRRQIPPPSSSSKFTHTSSPDDPSSTTTASRLNVNEPAEQIEAVGGDRSKDTCLPRGEIETVEHDNGVQIPPERKTRVSFDLADPSLFISTVDREEGPET